MPPPKPVPPPTTCRARGRFVFYLRGNDAYARGDHDGRRRPLARGAAALRAGRRPRGQAQRCGRLSFVVPSSEAAAAARAALGLARRASAAPLEALVQHGLSDTAYLSGRVVEGAGAGDDGAADDRSPGTPLEQARARLSLARLHRSHGNGDLALAEYRRAESLLAPLERGLGLSTAWATLSGGLLQLGQIDDALAASTRALAVARASGNDIDATFAALVGAEALLAQARPADALALIDAILTPAMAGAR